MRHRLALLLIFAVMGAGLLALNAKPAGALSCEPCPAVTTADLNLRAGPGTDHAVLAVMPNGATITVWYGEQVNGFLRTRYGSLEGWAYQDYIRGTLGQPPANRVVVTVDINLRAAPSLDAPIILVMPAGSTADGAAEVVNGFRHVTYNGIVGWAFNAYLG